MSTMVHHKYSTGASLTEYKNDTLLLWADTCGDAVEDAAYVYLRGVDEAWEYC